jgi:hypothetical protein
MAHLLGETHRDRFTIIDSEGTYLTGAVLESDRSYDPDGGTVDYAVGELGNGLYEIVWELDHVGYYYVRLVTTNVTPFQVFEFQVRTDDPEVGDTVTNYFTVRDDDGQFFGGAPITVLDTYDPNGATFAMTITDLADGLYQADFQATYPGVYSFRLQADLSEIGDDPQIFEFDQRVLPLEATGETPFMPAYGPSLDELVRDVALLCRDLHDTRATEDAPDASHWIDRGSLVGRSPKTFKGASLFVMSAASDANLGYETTVVDSADGVLTLSPALPSVPRRGDTAYLTNLESTGFPRQTYVNQINAHILQAFPNDLRPAVWTFTDRFDAASPYLIPPKEFTHLYDVAYPSSLYSPLEEHMPMTDRNRSGWYWDWASERIVIQGAYAAAVHGSLLTIRGFGRWEALTTNTETTGVDRQWLTSITAGDMIISLRDPKRMSEGAMRLNRADGFHVKMAISLPDGVIRIR